MERCIFKNNPIYAIDVTLKFSDEKTIREAGRNDQLFCYGCGQPVRYKRGEIRKAYFAHKNKLQGCDYDQYSKFCQKRSELWKNIKELLYQHFLNRYPEARIEKSEKLILQHWTDISVKFAGGKQYAIEIDDKSMTSKKLSDLCQTYENNNIIVDWVVLDKITDLKTDMDAYYIKRARLNESRNNTLIVIDKRDLSLAIYRMDTNQYTYSGTSTVHIFNHNIFCHLSSIDNLVLDNNGLSIEGFDEAYQQWLKLRKIEFEAAEAMQTKLREELQERSKYLIKNNSAQRNYPQQNKKLQAPTPKNQVQAYKNWDEAIFRNKIIGIAQGKLFMRREVVERLSKGGSSEFYVFLGLYEKAKSAVNEKPNAQQFVDIFESIMNQVGMSSFIIK